MDDQPNVTQRKRSRFRPLHSFSLRTMFVVVAVGGTGGYWLAREAAFQRANGEYERASASVDAMLISDSEACRASRQLFDAEVSVPFANHGKAAAAHRERIKRIYDKVQMGPAWDYVVIEEERAEVERYFVEAGSIASGNR